MEKIVLTTKLYSFYLSEHIKKCIKKCKVIIHIYAKYKTSLLPILSKVVTKHCTGISNFLVTCVQDSRYISFYVLLREIFYSLS